MDKSKILTIVASVLGLLGVVFLIMVMRAEGNESIDSSVGTFVGYATYLLIATAVIAVVLSLVQLIKQPAALKKALISIGALAVLFAIAYFASSDAIPMNASGEPMSIKGSGDSILTGEAAKSVAKWVGTLITFTAILGVVGLATIAIGFVKNVIK